MVGKNINRANNMAIYVLAAARNSYCVGKRPRDVASCTVSYSEPQHAFLLFRFPQDWNTANTMNIAAYLATAFPMNIDIIGPAAADMRSTLDVSSADTSVPKDRENS